MATRAGVATINSTAGGGIAATGPLTVWSQGDVGFEVPDASGLQSASLLKISSYVAMTMGSVVVIVGLMVAVASFFFGTGFTCPVLVLVE